MKAIPSSSKGSKKVSAVPTASTASAVSTTNGGGDCKRSVGTKAVRQGDHRPGGTKELQKKLKVGNLLQVHHEVDRDEDEVPESMEGEGEIDESDFLGEDDDDDDDDNSDEDDDEESENENWVSRSLYFLAHKLLRSSTSLAPQELNKASSPQQMPKRYFRVEPSSRQDLSCIPNQIPRRQSASWKQPCDAFLGR
jgi:TATA-binding protein-associated factor Taf7